MKIYVNRRSQWLNKEKLKFPILALCFFFILKVSAWSNVEASASSEDTTPLEVTINFYLNKIYNINTIDETFQVDGYLQYVWYDSSLIGKLSGLYENEQMDQLINTGLWWFPAFELINIQGEREVPNKSIEISSEGKVTYYERFFGTFDTNMDFKKFPFDEQNFKIEIEPFSYDTLQVIFTKLKINLEGHNKIFTKEWKMLGEPKYSIYNHEYQVDTIEYYSRAVFEIKAKRLTGYYLWEVLLPLFIIIMASFVIFWIKDFRTQIGIGFTLMLTVVAFNFYSASILPKLPYVTFIETLIFIDYVFIFMGIVAVIINHMIYGKIDKQKFNKLIKIFRFVFPVIFVITLFLVFLNYGII